MTEKMHELTLVEMRLPLGNIAGYRHSRPANLIGEAVEFSAGKTVRELIDEFHQIHRSLPHHEIFEVLGHKNLATGYWVLATIPPYVLPCSLRGP